MAFYETIQNTLEKGRDMKTVNALKIRNNLGEVLDLLTKTGEPVLVSKGRKIRAVLITPEQFQKRFLDWQAEEEKKRLLSTIEKLRADSLESKSSLAVLRELRGYGK
jgi:PHD/YefM family antitoxin component YafN of YafNO toxin-antitoxin module